MRENKAFASLSSGLLARKGHARPAMRPQGNDLGWNDMGEPVARRIEVRLPAAIAAAQPDMPAVLRQQGEIAREFAVSIEERPEPAVTPVEPVPIALVPAAVEPARKSAPVKAARRPATSAATPAVKTLREGRKAAFTLRLDAARHLRLRLACAVQNRSAQQIVTAALDELLSGLSDVERLATSLSGASAAPQD